MNVIKDKYKSEATIFKNRTKRLKYLIFLIYTKDTTEFSLKCLENMCNINTV